MARRDSKRPYQMSEDRALVDRMLAGDEAAFDRFCDDYFNGLYRFALTRLRHDEELAREIRARTACRQRSRRRSLALAAGVILAVGEARSR